jgi:hypothetical protein
VGCGSNKSSKETAVTERWWREETFEVGQVRSWQIGPLSLVVERSRQEWKLAHRWTGWEDVDPGWSVVDGGEFPEDGWEFTRFVFSSTGSSMSLVPALANRPVVTSPRVPLFVSPGERTVLFVSTPMWLQVKGEGQTLLELPIRRLSDTWFGPSTREGELCYSTKTCAALDVGNLPLLARRAVTPVQIKNRADSPLQIERLKLPVPLLSLFGSGKGTLWTEKVVMSRDVSSEMAVVTVRSGPPDEAQETELLTTAREHVKENLVIQVFGTVGSLLRGMGDGDD